MDTHTHPNSEQHHQIAGWLAAAGPDAHIELRSDIPIPTAAADEVVIRVECSGVWLVRSSLLILIRLAGWLQAIVRQY